METLIIEKNILPIDHIDLSEQLMVDYCTTYDCVDPGGCLGAGTYFTNKFVQNCGLPEEWCRRYEASDEPNCDEMSCTKKDYIDKHFRVQDIFFVNPYIEELKSALNEGPLIATMKVYYDFLFYVSGVYQRTPNSPTDNIHHLVEVIGYQDSDDGPWGGGYFICKNSFGTAWGAKLCTRINDGKYVCANEEDSEGDGIDDLQCGEENGFFCIAYDQTDINGVGFAAPAYLYKNISIPAHYSISGNIITNNPNYSVSNSIVNLKHYASHNYKWFEVANVHPNSSGAYQFASVLNWDYRVEPVEEGGWCFEPEFQDINLSSDLEGIDFSIGYNISGSARIAFTTKPATNVTINVSGPISDSTTTNPQGNFIFKNMLCGNYGITATKQGCYFPASPHYFTLSNSDYDVPTFYCLLELAGHLGPLHPSNSTITVTGTATNGEQINQTTTIDPSGNFTFYLPEGNYKFTPSSECMVYNPPFLQTNVVYGENISLNFTSSSWQICSSCYSTYFARELECKSLNDIEGCLSSASNEFKQCIIKKTMDANSSLYNAIILSIQVQRSKGKPEEALESFTVENEGDYFINITNGDNLNKDTAVSSAEVNLIGYGQLFGPQDFNKNVFQLKKQIHLLPGEYQVSTIVRSKPGSYLTILISNRDISSFQDLP